VASHPDEANTGGSNSAAEWRPHIEEDRRQSPRVHLLQEFQGHLITLDETVTVQELGPGGVTLVARMPLSPSHVHDLRLTLDDLDISVQAKVVHTRAVADGDEFTYVSGMAFVDPPPEAVAAIERFIGLDVFADGRR
jgi:hypothetical protein